MIFPVRARDASSKSVNPGQFCPGRQQERLQVKLFTVVLDVEQKIRGIHTVQGARDTHSTACVTKVTSDKLLLLLSTNRERAP
jgi:hypothetical protein